MDVFQKTVSNLIESQFPEYYRDDGQNFIDFCTQYFRWLEQSGNQNALLRSFAENIDVDECADQFLLYKKEKYLKNIQLRTNSSTRLLIKHSLDLYHSKGTARSADLLFRLVFGVGAKVYLPGDDVFRLSSAQWTVPRYLEVKLDEQNIEFVNHQIKGLSSKATAFVDRVVRKMVKGRLVDIFYISAISGNFSTGEKINFSTNPRRILDCPDIIGSLNAIEIDPNGTGFGYTIGDIIDVNSVSGYRAKARVSNVSSIVGTVNFSLVDGGFGYTSNMQLLVSDKVLSVANVVVNSAMTDSYMNIFEGISQNVYTLNYLNVANGQFAVNNEIFTYYGNNSVKGQATVVKVVESNSTAGTLTVLVESGTIIDNTIFTTANVVSANLNPLDPYTSFTATANVIGTSSNIAFEASSTTGTFIKGEKIRQINSITSAITAYGTILSVAPIFGSNNLIRCSVDYGLFLPNVALQGVTSNATATLNNLQLDVGVKNVNNQFFIANDNFTALTVAANTGVTFSVVSVSLGSGANLTLSTDLLNGELISRGTDLISPYLGVALNANAYGFPAMPTANLTTGILDNVFSTNTVEIGTISRILTQTPGSGYNKAPLVFVYDSLGYSFKLRSRKIIMLANAANYKVGEIITQSAVNSIAQVLSVSGTKVIAKRLNVIANQALVITTNSTTVLVGQDSNISANVVSVEDDLSSPYIGLSAVIAASTTPANGAITEVQVVDSGFGFAQGEQVDLGTGTNIGSGLAVLNKQGTGTGFWEDTNGFLSNVKKLFDGEYYQDYSYEIRSSVAVEDYRELVKKVIHALGTAFFGKFDYTKSANVAVNITSTVTANI